MKREFWEHDGGPIAIDSIVTSTAMGRIVFKKVVVHESRWIPVSERMPDKPDHYLVVRLDRLDWCYCEIENWQPGQIQFNPGQDIVSRFTSKGVTHWLEAPPLPVEDEFERWWNDDRLNNCYSAQDLTEGSLKDKIRRVWNAAKESTNT